VPVLLWLGSVPFLGTARLRDPIEPFLILLAAVAVVTVIDRPMAPAVPTDAARANDLQTADDEARPAVPALEAPLVG
jgi:hypothetical protein